MFFFFNDTATTEIYTLSLHDALPISLAQVGRVDDGTDPRGEHEAIIHVQVAEPGDLLHLAGQVLAQSANRGVREDRKSTRLNSSHANISYAVFCLKQKKSILSTPLVL